MQCSVCACVHVYVHVCIRMCDKSLCVVVHVKSNNTGVIMTDPSVTVHTLIPLQYHTQFLR